MTSMKCIQQSWRFGLIMLTACVAAAGLVSRACAQSPGRSVGQQKSGIRFEIKALIEPATASAKRNGENKPSRASLDVTLRISSHAVGSNFYGEIPQHFSDISLAGGSDERLYWQDRQCHQRRGLPTVKIPAIDGSITTKDRRIEVKARPRILGKLLPPDEISPDGSLRAAADKNGSYFAHRFQTESSHLVVTVKVYTIGCDLTGVAHAPNTNDVRSR